MLIEYIYVCYMQNTTIRFQRFLLLTFLSRKLVGATHFWQSMNYVALSFSLSLFHSRERDKRQFVPLLVCKGESTPCVLYDYSTLPNTVVAICSNPRVSLDNDVESYCTVHTVHAS